MKQILLGVFLVCLVQFLAIYWVKVDANTGNCGRTPPNKTMMVKALDKNNDMKLSPAEARSCQDCRLKCFCNGMLNAFTLLENDYDEDVDGLFSPEEIPDPPDDAPLLPSSPPSAEQILATLDMNGDGALSKKELRKCLKKHCGLNCPCKRMLETFNGRAGDDRKLTIDEFFDPGNPCCDLYYVVGQADDAPGKK